MKLGKLGNVRGLYTGKTISLNQKAATYFGVGDKIWLNEHNWSTEVPNDLTAEEISIIDDGINSGTIVMGEKWIARLEKDLSVRENYLDIVKNAKYLTDEVKEPFKQLILTKQNGNYTASEILTYVMNHERKTRGRTNFLTFLQDALNHYDGPAQLVSDGPHELDSYVNTEQMLKVDDSTKDKLSPPVVDESPSEAKLKALDELFESDII
jgi:hypothetical protein